MWWLIGLQAYASIMQGEQQAAAMREQAHISEIQGKISLEGAEFQAKMAREAGIEESQFIRRQSARTVGGMVVSKAASGVELSGSPLLQINDEIWQAERAAGTTISNSRARATSIEGRGRADEAGAEARASSLRSGADAAVSAGWINAVGAGVRGAAYQYAMTGGGARPVDYGSSTSQPKYQGDYATWGF